METKADFKNIVLKSALLLGGVGIAYQVLLYATGLLYSGSTGMSVLTTVISIAISVWFIAAAIQQYKNGNEGFLTVGEAIKVGAVVGLIAGVILAFYQVLYTTVIDPDYYQRTIDLVEQKMSAMGLSEEQLKTFTDEMAKHKPSLLKTFLSPLISGGIGGLVLGAIIGAVKKKERPSF